MKRSLILAAAGLFAAVAGGAHLAHARLTVAGPGPLSLIAFLAGEFVGSGEHSGGFEFEETQVAEWQLSDTVLVVRSKSMVGERQVFEDLRVFSYDIATAEIRCRQFCFNWVTTYEVEVDEETGVVTMEESAAEGGKSSKWRYSFTPGAEGEGFSYELETTDREGAWVGFLGGVLTSKSK